MNAGTVLYPDCSRGKMPDHGDRRSLGRRLGFRLPQMTPAQISLAPGNYNITLEKDGKRYSRSVDVHNGVINYLKLPLDE